MSQTQRPQTLFEKIAEAHRPQGAAAGMKAEVTLKTAGRKPKGYEDGHGVPGQTVKVPKALPLTQGAFGALACRNSADAENAASARINFLDHLPKGVEATDLALHAARLLPPAAENTTGWVVELTGKVIAKLQAEDRMHLCALLSQAPQVAATLIAPDNVTIKALAASDKEIAQWRPLNTDEGAEFGCEFNVQTADLLPQATWTTDITNSAGLLTELDDITAAHEKAALPKAGALMTSLPIDYAYIGPFEDFEADALEAAVNVFKGRKVASGVQVFVTPGSKALKDLAEQKGWDKTFIHSGCNWNPSDIERPDLKGIKRAAETAPLVEGKPHSPRSHYMSAQMVATAAICGRIADVRDFI